MQGRFFIIVDEVILAAAVDQKFAHFELPFPGSVEQTGLTVVIDLVDIDAEFDQQLGHFQSPELRSPVDRVLPILVHIVEIVLVSVEQLLDNLGPACIPQYLPSLAK